MNNNNIRLLLIVIHLIIIISCSIDNKSLYTKSEIIGNYLQLDLFGGTSLDLYKNGKFYLMMNGEVTSSYAIGKYRISEKYIYLYFKHTPISEFAPAVTEERTNEDSNTVIILSKGESLSFSSLGYYSENNLQYCIADYNGICKFKKSSMDSIRVSTAGMATVKYKIKNIYTNKLIIDVGDIIKPQPSMRTDTAKLLIINDKLFWIYQDPPYIDSTSNLGYFKKLK